MARYTKKSKKPNNNKYLERQKMEKKMNNLTEEQKEVMVNKITADTISRCTDLSRFDFEESSKLLIEMINLCIKRIGKLDHVRVTNAKCANGPSEARCMIEGLEVNDENIALVESDGYSFRELFVTVEWGWTVITGAYYEALKRIDYDLSQYTDDEKRICELVSQTKCAEVFICGEDMDATIIIVAPPVNYEVVGDQKVLHSEDRPALEFADGSHLWSLNGVSISRENRDLVTCEINEETARRILHVENVDERAQLIKKHGLAKFVDFADVVDDSDVSVSEYSLLDFGKLYDEDESALFLKMNNLSEAGKTHIEGVTNDCESIQSALDFRAEKILDFCGDEHWRPATIDGVKMFEDENQVQQGDVKMRRCDEKPEGAELLSHVALRGHDSRHVPTTGKLYKVNDDIEWLEICGEKSELKHPEHNTSVISFNVIVASGQEVDHETGIIDRLID
jgi:hypothetical protein